MPSVDNEPAVEKIRAVISGVLEHAAQVQFVELAVLHTLQEVGICNCGGLSARTQGCYVHAVRQLADHYHRSPDQITEGDLRQYFLYLANEKKVARDGDDRPVRDPVLLRTNPWPVLDQDAEDLAPLWQEITEQISEFRGRYYSHLSAEESYYFSLLSRYGDAVRETIDALIDRQRLMNEGSKSGRGNAMTWPGALADLLTQPCLDVYGHRCLPLLFEWRAKILAESGRATDAVDLLNRRMEKASDEAERVRLA